MSCKESKQFFAFTDIFIDLHGIFSKDYKPKFLTLLIKVMMTMVKTDKYDPNSQFLTH